MTRASFVNSSQVAVSGVRPRAGFLTWRELLMVAVAGVFLAASSQIFGRVFHLAWAIPMSGSIIMALPRAIILLVLLLRVNRFGALTAAAVAEIGTRSAFGIGGMWPIFLIAPLAGNLAGDLLWYWLRRLSVQRVKLVLTGATLCAARVLVALFFWSLLKPAIWKAPESLASLLVCIVAINIVLGAIAGFVVGRRKRLRRPAESE